MWISSNCVAGNSGLKFDFRRHNPHGPECSDDEDSSTISREEGLECPICWESFNIVENVPYVLWCGHSLCKNCILGLHWAVVKFPTLPIQLPFFISCPWCNLLSPRMVFRGNLKFPCKNYFLLWMVEGMNCDRRNSQSVYSEDHNAGRPSNAWRGHQSESNHTHVDNYSRLDGLYSPLWKSLVFFVNLTTKFPLVLIFLLIVLYAIPASAAILVLYILITAVFAIPSFLILYFSYPSLDWLVKEIIN